MAKQAAQPEEEGQEQAVTVRPGMGISVIEDGATKPRYIYNSDGTVVLPVSVVNMYSECFLETYKKEA